MPLATLRDPASPVLSQFSLEGKVAAVTGGCRGIGLEVSKGLAEAGATVAIIYTSSKEAHEIAQDIAKKTGSKVKAYKSDVRHKDTITRTLNEIVTDAGQLDICVANAGVGALHDSLECTPKDWRDIMEVNLDGAMYTAQAAGNIFKHQGSGNLIFTASVSGTLVSTPQKQSAYNASKAAIIHFARSLAVEWAGFARVNSVSPGFIETDMIATLPGELKERWIDSIPACRLGNPAELKAAYVYLASEASSYMVGADLIIDGGLSLP